MLDRINTHVAVLKVDAQRSKWRGAMPDGMASGPASE